MCRNRGIRGRDFGRSEIESESVRARLKVDERFEVRSIDWPLYRRKAVLVVADGDLAIDRLLDVCALAVDEEDLLMDLPMMLVNSSYSIEQERAIPRCCQRRKEREAQATTWQAWA